MDAAPTALTPSNAAHFDAAGVFDTPQGMKQPPPPATSTLASRAGSGGNDTSKGSAVQGPARASPRIKAFDGFGSGRSADALPPGPPSGVPAGRQGFVPRSRGASSTFPGTAHSTPHGAGFNTRRKAAAKDGSFKSTGGRPHVNAVLTSGSTHTSVVVKCGTSVPARLPRVFDPPLPLATGGTGHQHAHLRSVPVTVGSTSRTPHAAAAAAAAAPSSWGSNFWGTATGGGGSGGAGGRPASPPSRAPAGSPPDGASNARPLVLSRTPVLRPGLVSSAGIAPGVPMRSVSPPARGAAVAGGRGGGGAPSPPPQRPATQGSAADASPHDGGVADIMAELMEEMKTAWHGGATTTSAGGGGGQPRVGGRAAARSLFDMSGPRIAFSNAVPGRLPRMNPHELLASWMPGRPPSRTLGLQLPGIMTEIPVNLEALGALKLPHRSPMFERRASVKVQHAAAATAAAAVQTAAAAAAATATVSAATASAGQAMAAAGARPVTPMSGGPAAAPLMPTQLCVAPPEHNVRLPSNVVYDVAKVLGSPLPLSASAAGGAAAAVARSAASSPQGRHMLAEQACAADASAEAAGCAAAAAVSTQAGLAAATPPSAEGLPPACHLRSDSAHVDDLLTDLVSQLSARLRSSLQDRGGGGGGGGGNARRSSALGTSGSMRSGGDSDGATEALPSRPPGVPAISAAASGDSPRSESGNTHELASAGPPASPFMASASVSATAQRSDEEAAAAASAQLAPSAGNSLLSASSDVADAVPAPLHAARGESTRPGTPLPEASCGTTLGSPLASCPGSPLPGLVHGSAKLSSTQSALRMQPSEPTIVEDLEADDPGGGGGGGKEAPLPLEPTEANDVVVDGVRVLGGKYEVEHVVGEGAYGLVMKCTVRDGSGRCVAIKSFKIEDDDPDADDVKRTARREVELLRALQHEHVVGLVDQFYVRDRLFIVMEFVPCNLLEVLEAQAGGMDRDAVRVIMYQLCRVLAHIHERGVVYRDVKPENLLVDEAGCVKLCDFGFARYVNKPGERLTDYVATRWYRAPELLLGPPFVRHDGSRGQYMYGPPVDMWAVGCLMGELLDGEPLFPGDSDLDQMYRVQQVLGKLPEGLQAVFDENPQNTGIYFYHKEHTTLARHYEGRVDAMELDFLAGLLTMDPAKRLTGEQCLLHPYLASLSGEEERAARLALCSRGSLFTPPLRGAADACGGAGGGGGFPPRQTRSGSGSERSDSPRAEAFGMSSELTPSGSSCIYTQTGIGDGARADTAEGADSAAPAFVAGDRHGEAGCPMDEDVTETAGPPSSVPEAASYDAAAQVVACTRRMKDAERLSVEADTMVPERTPQESCDTEDAAEDNAVEGTPQSSCAGRVEVHAPAGAALGDASAGGLPPDEASDEGSATAAVPAMLHDRGAVTVAAH